MQFEYTGRDEKTTIDLGLLGPDGFRGQDGFRGWSGGNKALFTLSASDATLPILPGPIRSGTWSLLLGIPNIRKDTRAEFTARIWFDREGEPYWQPQSPILRCRSKPAGIAATCTCTTRTATAAARAQTGVKVPCPLFLTAQAATARGLDFIAITDHNTTSQANAIRELQPYFDGLLLIPGREITTFSGHANLFGRTAPLDFRVGGDRDWNALLRDAAALQGIVSINHPVRPSDELCMGCGWTPRRRPIRPCCKRWKWSTAWTRIRRILGIAFWESLLDAGYRLTAIGGSDNHDASQMSPGIGGGPVGIRPPSCMHRPCRFPKSWPVCAQATCSSMCRAAAIAVWFSARVAVTIRRGWAMRCRHRAGSAVEFGVRVANAFGARVEVMQDGRSSPEADPPIKQAAQTLRFDWRSDGKPHWCA